MQFEIVLKTLENNHTHTHTENGQQIPFKVTLKLRPAAGWMDCFLKMSDGWSIEECLGNAATYSRYHFFQTYES